MSNDMFGLLAFVIVAIWPVSWLILATVYRKYFVSVHLASTAPRNLAEYYKAELRAQVVASGIKELEQDNGKDS